MPSRRASVRPDTKEAKVAVSVDLDGTGPFKAATGIAFFDRILEQVAHHGEVAPNIDCHRDLHIDPRVDYAVPSTPGHALARSARQR